MAHTYDSRGICTKCGCNIEAVEAFNFTCKDSAGPRTAVKRGKGQVASAGVPKGANVFISHSHADRDTTVNLNRILIKNGAEVFLDQDRIEAGDPLPDRLRDGIRWCNRFLLIWSWSASQSAWVHEEWDYAYSERKKILPYVLDDTPLPDALENLVYVMGEDRSVGHANLLAAIFGKAFKPADSTELFPGLWRACLAIQGLADATYDLELRRNGQVVGSGSMGQSGMFGELARQAGFGNLLNMKIPIRGQWSYEDVARTLTLDMTAEGFGTSNHEVIKITTTGRERDALYGQDLASRPWMVQRVS